MTLVENKSPYFGAAEHRHLVEGTGDERGVFGLLPPNAWSRAQEIFNRNPEDAPEALLEPVRGRAATLIVSVIGLVLCVVVVTLLLSWPVAPTHPLSDSARITIAPDGRLQRVDGPAVVTGADRTFDVPAGAVLAYPDTD